MKNLAVGTIKGPWQIIGPGKLRDYVTTRRSQRMAYYQCECVHCGAKSEVGAHRLAVLEKRGVKYCWACHHKTPAPVARGADWYRYRDKRESQQVKPSLVECTRCMDMPWRRPENGARCKCGKRYAQETIDAPALVGSSSGMAL